MADMAMPDQPPSSASTSDNAPQPRPARRHRWVWVALIAVLAVSAVVFIRWRDEAAAKQAKASKAPPAIPVVTVNARKGDIGVYVTGLGTVTPLNTITVKSRVDGELLVVAYQEGQLVKRGQALVEIDPRPYQVQLEQAQGQLTKDQAAEQNAEKDLERYQELIKRNAVAQQILETQKATVAQDKGTVVTDQANIDSAKLNITYCHITAPIDGRVGLRLVDRGNMVSAASGTPLVVITETQPISIIFTIPEQQVDAIHAAMRGGKRLPVDAFDRDQKSILESGDLTTLDNQIDQTTGTLRLRATVPNKNETLYPNQFVNTRVLLQKKTGVTLVPNAAIQRNGSRTYVFVVKPDQTVTLRNVNVGTTEGDDSEITSGLKPGELVVTKGVDKLQEGTKVIGQSADEQDTDRSPSSSQAPPASPAPPRSAVATSGRAGKPAATQP
jgi:multidrug efflux system membrane fusion protein